MLDTYGEIIADIQDKFSETSAGFGSETQVSIRNWISQFEYDIYSERLWPFMQSTGTITTVASTQNYVLASDYSFGSLRDVTDTTNTRKLVMISPDDYDLVFPASSTTGIPLYFFLWGTDDTNMQEINFFPIPDSAYTISYRYYKDPTPVDIATDTSNDGESPILPRRYRRLLVDAVLEELFQKDVNPSADRVNVKYQNLLDRMVRDYSRMPAARHVRKSTDFLSSTPLVRLPDNFPYN